MLLINLHNVEQMIFSDAECRALLPDLRHLFDQWMLSKRVPTLRSLRMRSLMDLINGLTSDHVRTLEEYFHDKIALDKLDYHIVRSLKLPLEFDPDREFADFSDYSEFVISRSADQLYVSFWR
jgi:hypothetical protein